jgi:hypothetical protein
MTGIALKDAGCAFLGDHKAKPNLLIGTDKKIERKINNVGKQIKSNHCYRNEVFHRELHWVHCYSIHIHLINRYILLCKSEGILH